MKADTLDTRIIEGINDCITLLDLEGRLLQINQAGIEIFERGNSTAILNMPLADLFDRDGNSQMTTSVATALAGKSSRFNTSFRTPSKKLKWGEVTVSPVTEADGKVSKIIAYLRDITERKRKEEFLALERSMLDKVTSGFALKETLESLIFLIEQYSGDTLCCVLLLGDDGKSVQETYAPNFPKEYTEAVNGLLVSPQGGSCGTAMYRKKRVIVEDIFTDPLWEGFDDIKHMSGGSACWSTPILAEDNKVVGTFAIYAHEARKPTTDELELMESASQFVRYTVDKHQAHVALRKSEARNRAMIQAVPDWVFLTTPEAIILDCHVRDSLILTGATAEFLDSDISKVIPEPLGELIANAIKRVSRSDEREDLEGTLETDDGVQFFETSVVRCDGENVLCIVRNVTNYMRASIDSANQRAELAHLSRVAVLGEITGALAHELSQPLAIIRTNADVARKVLNSDNVRVSLLRETVDDIINSSHRAGEVINRLRALLKKEEPKFEPIDLDEAVREIVALANSEILARSVTVHLDLQGVGPVILGDRIQLQQVILNLLMNACDAMKDVAEKNRQLYFVTKPHGKFVELSVRDSGVGIAEDQLERVFQPFVSSGKDGQGMGLGLAISRTIVDAHKGKIFAENNDNGGASFHCRFPIIVNA